MIRQKLTALLFCLLIVAEPCLATADTNNDSKKPPQKAAPKVPESTSPSKSSRLKKYRSLNTYHPHHAKGHHKPAKPSTT
jgi:hypothetical protein